MGRNRSIHFGFPPRFSVRKQVKGSTRYYYKPRGSQKAVPLGDNLGEALEKYSRLDARAPNPVEVNGRELLLGEHIVALAKPMAPVIGVYFLVGSDHVLYVGQSISIRDRLRQHVVDRRIPFALVYWVECEVGELDRLESAYIRTLKPEFNKETKASKRTPAPRMRKVTWYAGFQ